jgi:hypothetical protein
VVTTGQREHSITIEHSLGLCGKRSKAGQVPVAHACNPRDSGGRDQEDRGSKPAQANSSQDPILKTPITKKNKKRLVEWLKV